MGNLLNPTVYKIIFRKIFLLIHFYSFTTSGKGAPDSDPRTSKAIHFRLFVRFVSILQLIVTMKPTVFLAILTIIPLVTISQTDNYHGPLVEDFSDPTSIHFRYGSTGNKSEFKYQLGVDSPTEEGIKILSFKIDPTDSAGAGRGPEIISKNLRILAPIQPGLRFLR